MASFSSDNDPSRGSLNLQFLLTLPQVPVILLEWAAIVPLVCHLASHRSDYNTVGRLVLSGNVGLGLFPKLGTLSGLARLLTRGPEFLDQASTRGGATSTVWDVKWGSVFPCANGAASELIKAYAQARSTKIPRRLPSTIEELTDASEECTEKTIDTDRPGHFRRYQTLNVLRFQLKPPHRRQPSPLKHRFGQTLLLSITTALLISLAVLFASCGAFGSAALLLCSSISKVAASFCVAFRPPGYLESSEGQMDACMLVAPHENAQEWTLYVGDRSVVDTVLNKAMTVIPEDRRNALIAGWFRAAHVFQLLAMTYVAGQKGWDGLFLVMLLVVDTLLRWHDRGLALANTWLNESHVSIEASAFLFGSRMVMLGAIETLAGCQTTSWMDKILVPHPRREAWLRCLRGDDFDEAAFDDGAVSWIKLSSRLARTSADIIRAHSMAQSV